MIWLLSIPIAFGLIFMYYANRFTTGNNNIRDAYANIDVFLKKRHDLIPNLVSVAKVHMTGEKETFESVTQLRSEAIANDNIQSQVELENGITDSLFTILANVEAYPNLKSDTHFLNIQDSLQEVENGLERARRYYNGCTRDYNNSIQKIPGSIFASILGKKEAPFFTAPKSHKNPL